MENKNKEHKIFIILLIILIFLILIIGITIGISSIADKKEENLNKPQEKEKNSELTITCIKEDVHDDVTKTEEVYLKNDIIITRTDISEWNKEEATPVTCEYYTLQTTKLNEYEGITSSVVCDDKNGKATTIYTIDKVDKSKMKLKQFDYVDENYKFDSKSWTLNMKMNDYICTSK